MAGQSQDQAAVALCEGESRAWPEKIICNPSEAGFLEEGDHLRHVDAYMLSRRASCSRLGLLDFQIHVVAALVLFRPHEVAEPYA